MRSDIFYWKCDSPVEADRKKRLFFQEKYDSGKAEAAREAIRDFLGHPPEAVETLSADGNHLTYRFRDGGKEYLLRADEGAATDDVYMLAESAVIDLLRRQGLPVATVFLTDVSMVRYPFRFQVMDYSPFPCLNRFAKAGTLQEGRIAEQSGRFLGALHGFRFPGFGFFDTDELQATGKLRGLDCSCAEYFHKRLENHFAYLCDHALLTAGEERRIRRVFERGAVLLNLAEGSLLHRDFAYWNLLGDELEIRRVIDWDDCVCGDPADDLGIVNCFWSRELMELLLKSYSQITPVDDAFRVRVHLHTLRNMLWKTMIRDYMGYFDRREEFFLCGGDVPLREFTLCKLRTELEELEKHL